MIVSLCNSIGCLSRRIATFVSNKMLYDMRFRQQVWLYVIVIQAYVGCNLSVNVISRNSER